MKFTVLSLGAGVQSSTLALMAAKGEIELPDCAIFADTGWEPKHVMDYLAFLEKELPFPVYRVMHNGGIKSALSNHDMRSAAVPFFTSNGGMGMRQCSNEYKIVPIKRKIREVLGYSKGRRIPPNSVTMMIGISLDESLRQKPSRDKWIMNIWPLVERRMTRGHCLEWIAKHGYPTPPKSSCLGCPYHSDKQWLELKKGNTEEWHDIVQMDQVIRHKKGMEHDQFMHRSMKPINEVQFTENNTIDMFINECEGICGV